MSYPNGYPKRLRESIFAHPGTEAEPGGIVFVFTRAGSRLKVYAMQKLGETDEQSVWHAVDHGYVQDIHYDPTADDAEPEEDVEWAGERPRLSQPVRRWMDDHDMAPATRSAVLSMVASEKGFRLRRV
jgi:hypothetical protein